MSNTPVIVGAARTAMCGLSGALSSKSAPELGAVAIAGCLSRSSIPPEAVDECLGGIVLSAGVGQAPARQAALAAGLSESTVCTSINKMCASGMKAVGLAAQSLLLGNASVVVAGGMESMSKSPYLSLKARQGLRMGHGELTDSMILDGLTDAFGAGHMGNCAEHLAAEMNFGREEQDAFAAESYRRCRAAAEAGIFAKEIVPVMVSQGRNKPEVAVAEDDEPTRFDAAKLAGLRPAFKKDGTVTAGNASVISDGAAFLALTTEAEAQRRGLPVLAKIRSAADAEQAPMYFSTAPAKALRIAFQRAGLEQKDIGVFEINEAFSVVSLGNNALLGLNPECVNVHGGAVALGHPIGASGARILISLLSSMAATNSTYGAAAICNGGGGATAMILERGEGLLL